LKLFRTESFKRDFQSLPKDLQPRAEKAILLLTENPRHPSLRAKKIKGTKDSWEASVTMSHRIVYTLVDDTLILRRIGTHNILKRVPR